MFILGDLKCSFFPVVPSPDSDLYLYLAEPACFWFDCTHLFFFWITIKSFCSLLIHLRNLCYSPPPHILLFLILTCLRLEYLLSRWFSRFLFLSSSPRLDLWRFSHALVLENRVCNQLLIEPCPSLYRCLFNSVTESRLAAAGVSTHLFLCTFSICTYKNVSRKAKNWIAVAWEGGKVGVL